MALGVDMAGDAIEEDPPERLASGPNVSTELREEDGKATEVMILSTLGCGEEELEEASAWPAPKCGLLVAGT